ncbi:MAG: ATP-binding protein [Actinomycetota bacterium]|nr:ATP-binding protein [Actinomycetota bacterium]
MVRLGNDGSEMEIELVTPVHSLAQHIDAEASSVSVARADARDALENAGIGRELVDDTLLVATELLANAVEHAPEGLIVFRMDVALGRWILVEVECAGSMDLLPELPNWGPDEPLAPRGRGLAIVDALSDSVAFSDVEGRLRIAALRFVGVAPPAAAAAG